MWAAIRDNIWLAIAIVTGLFVAIVCSENHSPKEALARVVAGLFCAIFFPGPVIDFFERDPAIYGNAVAGLFAITGYAFARWAVNPKWNDIAVAVSIIRGKYDASKHVKTKKDKEHDT